MRLTDSLVAEVEKVDSNLFVKKIDCEKPDPYIYSESGSLKMGNTLAK